MDTQCLKIFRLVLVLSILVLFVGCGGSKSSSVGPESNVTVSGLVLDSNSKPVPSATVTIKSNPIVATTDESVKS